MLVQDDHMPVHSGGVSEGEQVGAHLAGVTNQRGSSLSCYILCLEGRIGPTGPPGASVRSPGGGDHVGQDAAHAAAGLGEQLGRALQAADLRG